MRGVDSRILFLTPLTIHFSRFGVHLGCSFWVLRRDSTSRHVQYESYELIEPIEADLQREIAKALRKYGNFRFPREKKYAFLSDEHFWIKTKKHPKCSQKKK